MTTGRPTGESTLPRSRFAPVGGARTTPARAALAAAALALAASAAWLGWSALRPAPAVIANAPPVPITPKLGEARPLPQAERRRLVQLLSAGDAFRVEAARLAAATAEDAAAGADPSGAAAQTPADRPRNITIDTSGATPVELTAPEDVPNDLRDAFFNLQLVAVHMSRSGTPYATISLRSNKEQSPLPLVAGAEFTDPKYEKAPWSIVRIDPARHRVIVARDGENFAMDLFPLEARIVAGDVALDPAKGEVIIAYATIDDVLADLRADGISEEDIADLVAGLKFIESGDPLDDPTRPKVRNADQLAELRRLAEQAAATGSLPEGADPGAAGPASMPPELLEIFRRMGNNESPLDPPPGSQPQPDAAEPEPAPESQPEPEPSPED